MDRKELLREIKDHCKRTGESAYAFGKRVLGDKAFVWKLRNNPRQPWPRTSKKIMRAINRKRTAVGCG